MDAPLLIDKQGTKRKRIEFGDKDESPVRFQYSDLQTEKPRPTISVAYRYFSTLWEALDSDDDEKESMCYAPDQEKLLFDLMASFEKEIGEFSQTSSLTCPVQNKRNPGTHDSTSSLFALNTSMELCTSSVIDLKIVDYDDTIMRTAQDYLLTNDSHLRGSAVEITTENSMLCWEDGENCSV
eukprot:c15895_g1_i1 orf=249-794(+)